MSNLQFDNIIEKFHQFTNKPVKYLNVQTDVKEDIKVLVKSLYDYTKEHEGSNRNSKSNALSKLIIKDFDEEQIWQEIELQNSESLDKLVSDIANYITVKDRLKFPLEEKEEQLNSEEDLNYDINMGEDGMEEENEIDEDEEMESEIDETEESTKKQQSSKQKHYKSSIVDDKFFKLNEMEEFLLKEEKNDGVPGKRDADSDEESIDMFEEEDDDDGEDGMEDNENSNNIMYSDFFGGDDGNYEKDARNSSKKKVRFESNLEDESSSGDDSNDSVINEKVITGIKDKQKQSDFEERQSRIKQQIGKIEDKHLSEAPWQMKGEINASHRPINSLLEELVDFDLTSRPAPAITEETTLTLEGIIKSRIKDKVWDDVVRKEKPVNNELILRKEINLDQSKSKKSLAQIYEEDYLRQKHGTNEEETEPESHIAIREAMQQLFSKLDALSHYHFTPKPAQAEVKIVTNTPAVAMEEVAPVATSDAALLAPEEVKKKRRGELMSKEERTATDKKRERRKKKQHQRENPNKFKKDSNKSNKGAIGKNVEKVNTSKAFFQKLNG